MPGYVLPPEWAPQSAVQLTWPHGESDWLAQLETVEAAFVEIARRISGYEPVLVVCAAPVHQEHVAGLLERAGVDPGRVRYAIAPSNDTWARDHGPITVLEDGKPLLLDFGFNGWGLKYRANLDNQITRRLQQTGAFGDTPLKTVGLVLEGGGIETDGAGTLLSTSQCLLSPNRNPHLTLPELEAELRRWLGVERILWLTQGFLAGDDTDSHIDTLARFCDPDTIAYVSCDDPYDAHYGPLQGMAAELRGFRTARGAPYRLVPLPWPRPKFNADGARLPATYANFLIINGAVLVPTYDDPKDAEALATLRSCFPEREVLGVPSSALIAQYGSLHCVTMQLPSGVVP